MKRKTVAEGWVPITHGIPSSYIRGCRCDECTAGHAAHQKKHRSSTKNRDDRLAEREFIDGRWVHPDPYGGHGSVTAYTSCGCRCDECRAAVAERQRVRRAQGHTS